MPNGKDEDKTSGHGDQSGSSGHGNGGGGGNPGSGGGEGGNSGHGGGHGEHIKFFVNEQPVTVDDEKQTGISIKQAAITQGVQIQLDFILSIERGGGKTELVGDNDSIKVKDGDRFLAIQNDDNS